MQNQLFKRLFKRALSVFLGKHNAQPLIPTGKQTISLLSLSQILHLSYLPFASSARER
jgi:hypothetical protein